jgi:hypothetical protein
MINAFKSRTNWTIAVGVLVTVIQVAQPFMSPEVYALVSTIIGAVAVYFRTYPSQNPE